MCLLPPYRAADTPMWKHFFSMDQECWTAAHVNAFKYFGGVTRILQCDNLKTGVITHGRSEVTLNKAYNDLAEHYGTAILPCRVRSPKDKAMVEGTVGGRCE